MMGTRTLLALCAAAVFVSPAAADTFTWSGDAGTNGWGDILQVQFPPDPISYVNNWGRYGNPPAFPGTADDVVIATAAVIQNRVPNPDILTLDLGSSASLTMGNGYTLTLRSDSTIDGTIHLADTASSGVADLVANGSLTLGGSGGVVFDTAYNNRLRPMSSSYVMTIGPSHTVETLPGAGAGDVMCRITNNGLIDANDGTITLLSYDKQNNNLMRASNGGTLTVSSITLDNAAGVLTADPNSILNLYYCNIDGGTINGGGGVELTGTCSVDDVHLDNVTARIDNGDVLAVDTALTNDAVIRLADTGSSGTADLRIDNSLDFSGTGRVVFATQYNNRIAPGKSTAVLTVTPNQIIETLPGASGQILTQLANNGLIDANDGTISLISYAKQNNNLLRASNGGTLQINAIPLNNAAGVIAADPTSTVSLYASTITGGTINGGGVVDVSTYTIWDDVYVDNVDVMVSNGEQLRLQTALTNDAVIHLADTGSSGTADLKLNNSSINLAGSGRVVFETAYSNRIVTANSAYVLTVTPTQTIETAPGGAGDIMCRITNNGLIDANDGTISLMSYAKQNNNLLRASNGGTLHVHSVTIDNAAGVLTADPTSTLDLYYATIDGGTINGGGGGELTGTCTVDDVHLDNVDVTIDNADTLYLQTALTNDGVVRLEDTISSGQAELKLNSSIDLGGSGQVVFATNYTNRITTISSSYLLTLGPDQTLAALPGASGQIMCHLTNHGTIQADGTILCTSSRTLTNAADGTITGSGQINLAGAPFVNNGTTAPGTSPGILEFVGDFTQSADAVLEIDIAGYVVGDEYDRLAVTGSATLDGWLDIILAGAFSPTPGDTFDILTATGGVTDSGLALLPADVSAWQLNWLDTTLQAEYIPEPATLFLLAAGAAALLRPRRR